MHSERYINQRISRDLRQCVGSNSTMKSKIVSFILTCFNLLLLGGIHPEATKEIGRSETRRILNGEIGPPSRLKYVVRIYVWTGDELGSAFCGGTVISSHFVLTAAHCTHFDYCDLTVIFPSTWKLGDPDKYHAEQCWHHPMHNFSFNHVFYDVGLIKTKDDLVALPEFEALELPPPGTRHCEGTEATVYGWGLTETGYPANELRMTTVKVMSWSKCNEEFKDPVKYADPNVKYKPDIIIPKNSFCTEGQKTPPKGICVGDSGGPVMVDGILGGIISGSLIRPHKLECTHISVHINVADFLPWIYSITEPDKDTSHIKVFDSLPKHIFNYTF